MLTKYLLASRNDLQEGPADNAWSILTYRWVLLKGRAGTLSSWICNNAYTDITEASYLPETKSAQPAKLIALTWACQPAKDQVTCLLSGTQLWNAMKTIKF